MQFLYCFDKNTKDKLVLNGYKFMYEKHLGEKIIFLFANNTDKLTFSKGEVFYTDKLTF